MEFHYHGIRRWEGVWDNPNLYGLLMGVGLTLAVGQLVWSLESGVSSRKTAARVLGCGLWLAAVGLCGFGLVKSFSRGAWLGTAVGLGFLLWRWSNHEIHELHEKQEHRGIGLLSCHSCVSWFRKVRLPISVLLASVIIVCFWQFRHTESPLVRRVFSVGNVNDFSWRNRVSAWQGAGRMMLDQPLLGFGWVQAEEIYGKEYRAARLDESAAIQLNDYLTLGISAGVPALVCFLAYVALAGRQVWRAARCRFPEPSTLNFQLSTTAAAGALVLLVGFWFDGGLFKLPTAVVFWMLLELARIAPLPSLSPSEGERMATLAGPGEGTSPHTVPAILLRWLAGILALAALGATALHLIVPQLAVSERTLAIARNYLIPAREGADFNFLAAQSNWPGKPLQHLIQQVHLANYNRGLVNWKFDDAIYRPFVLSSEIDPAWDGEMNWRRPLWEFFYPRIRKESSLEAAAETVLRQLHERVMITETAAPPKTIAEMWEHGNASRSGLAALCVAAMRSAGIPARLPGPGYVEFWNGAEWKPVQIREVGDNR